MAGNHLADLETIIDDLDSTGRVAHVNSEVDLKHDLAGIAAELEGEPRAVLFHKVAGHEAPVFTGLYWSRPLLAHLLRQDEQELPRYVSGCIQQWQKNPQDPVVVDDGPILQGRSGLSLSDLPVPVHAQKDGGAYFDAGVVIATDPETGVRNASIQRFMVVDDRTLHVNIDAGRHLGLYLEKARKLGKSLFLSINCGVGPGLHFAAATPAEAAPPESDELGIASEFHGAALQLVRGKMTPVELVANAMYAIECEMIPGETGDEGPFAEVTGYYARCEPRPVVRVRAIHARANPVFQTILSGAEVWNSVGLLGEANVLATLKRQIPGVQNVYFTHGGCGFYHAVVSLLQKRAGWGKQAIMATFAAFPPLKMVTVVDDDVNIRDASDVEWAMATRLDAKTGIVTIDQAFGHGLNPGFPDYLGCKVGFDCTRPFPHSYEYDRAAYKSVSLDMVDIGDSPAASIETTELAFNPQTDEQAGSLVAGGSSLTSAAVRVGLANAANEADSSSGPRRVTNDAAGNKTPRILVIYAGKDTDTRSQRQAADLFVELEARLIDYDLSAFERARTEVEFKSILKSFCGQVTHLIVISGGKRGKIRFADQQSVTSAKRLGKLINSLVESSPVQVLLCRSPQQIDEFAGKLSTARSIREAVFFDHQLSSDWVAHLLGGYFMCISSDDRTEVALRNAMPPAFSAEISVWRDGKPFTRLNAV
ncbi:hypothetical protein AB833_24775 [Chromatiales bacterium (ex Bugula neritina AB1)]|nr:hypothetical protein AB833_24775 [Chromatiales bacterium (ex Bugula neritina AB1)]